MVFFVGQAHFFSYTIPPAFRSDADFSIGIEGDIAL